MSAATMPARLTPVELLDAVRQLGDAELEEFIPRVLALRKPRPSALAERSEPELIALVHQDLPGETNPRFLLLKKRLEDGTLTAEEQAELIPILDARELQNARRVEALSMLAQRRGATMRQVAGQLSLKLPSHG